MPEFRLQFDAARIPELAARFGEDGSDEAIREVGARARRRGHYTKDELLTVYRWKAARSLGRVAPVSEARVVEATKRSFAARDDTDRFEALTALPGVGAPVASALLHAAFPDEYPILDYRALESLGVKRRSSYPTGFWLEYVKACRRLAREAGVSLRTLDKALWEYSKLRAC